MATRKRIPLLVLCAVLRAVAGQDGFRQPVQEVFENETPYPQGRGEVQVRLLSLFDRYRAARGPDLPVGFEYGITDRLQVSAGWRGLGSQPGPLAPGLASACTEVGIKRAFLGVGGLPVHAAVGLEAAIYRGRPEYAPFFAAAAELPSSKPSHVLFSIARSFAPGAPPGSVASWFWAGGTLFRIRDNVHASAEVSSGMRGSEDRSLHLTPGVIWRVDGLGEFGVGLAVGTGPARGRAGLIVSFVHEFRLPRR